MNFPPIYDTLTRNAWRLKRDIAPYFLPLIVLIGLLIYRLATSNNMSDDAKKKLSYAEIAFSVVGSLPVLAWFGFVVIGGIVFTLILFAIGGFGFFSGGNNKPSNFYKDIPILLLYFITFIILNPVSLTALRIHLHDTLTEQQQNIIAGITIPVAIYVMYLTVLIFSGFFHN
jgi:hypothetical protein